MKIIMTPIAKEQLKDHLARSSHAARRRIMAGIQNAKQILKGSRSGEVGRAMRRGQRRLAISGTRLFCYYRIVGRVTRIEEVGHGCADSLV